MFRDDGSLALIDFGVAKQLADPLNLTRAGLAVGTPHYISPEQVDGAGADARSDLYALGVVLYEMLTGCVPYSARTAMAVMYKHKHAPVPALPRSLQLFQPLIERLLAKDPGARLQSVAELRAALPSMAES
jgi:serine/threonine-protein kinase PpkA